MRACPCGPACRENDHLFWPPAEQLAEDKARIGTAIHRATEEFEAAAR